MEVIAKQKDGYLIHASKDEIESILTAVNGKAPDELSLGQRIPAIDYATTINKIKKLSNDYHYKEILKDVKSFNETVCKLQKAIEGAASIEI